MFSNKYTTLPDKLMDVTFEFRSLIDASDIDSHYVDTSTIPAGYDLHDISGDETVFASLTQNEAYNLGK